MLRRYTPLKPSKSLKRTAPIKRTYRDPVPRKVREELMREYDGRCARCGRPATCLHHVKKRSQGSKHTKAEVVPFCDDCNRWVEEHPVEAYREGWNASRKLAAMEAAGLLVSAKLDAMGEQA